MPKNSTTGQAPTLAPEDHKYHANALTVGYVIYYRCIFINMNTIWIWEQLGSCMHTPDKSLFACHFLLRSRCTSRTPPILSYCHSTTQHHKNSKLHSSFFFFPWWVYRKAKLHSSINLHQLSQSTTYLVGSKLHLIHHVITKLDA
ncbi:hypothetical protein CsSME_00011576 [Camellia sinensis var. sinensis]